MQKITFFTLLLVTFLALTYASPAPMPEAEPETDENRMAFRNCLKDKCYSECREMAIPRWRLFTKTKCDNCAKEECEAKEYGYTEWMNYNNFIHRRHNELYGNKN